MTGGTLDINGKSPSIGSLSILDIAVVQDTGSPLGTLTATAYSISNATGLVTISAKLAGSGAALTMSGAGPLTLSGANTYTGGTTINAGRLFGGAGSGTRTAFGSGLITINNGATL